MSRRNTGRRFKTEEKPKLNLKKVVFVLLIPILIYTVYSALSTLDLKTKTVNIKRINKIAYFSSFENGKWGVINSNGEKIIDNTYDEMIIIPNSEKDLFITTEVINKETNEFQTKVINSNKNEILKSVKNVIPIEYDSNELTYDKDLLLFKKDNKFGLVNYEGVVKFEATFDEVKPLKNIVGKLKVIQDKKEGVINTTTSNYTVPVIYKSVEPIWENKDTFYKIVFENKVGVVSNLAVQILKTEYDSIENIESNDFVVAKVNGISKIYDNEGKEVANGIQNIKKITKDKLIVVSKNDKFGVYNFNNKEILENIYEEIIPTTKDIFIVKENGKYNLVVSNKEGNTELEERKVKKLPTDYDNIEYNKSGDIFIATKDGKSDFYDTNMNKKLENSLLLKVETDYMIIKNLDTKEEKFYDFKFNEVEEKIVYKNNNLIRFKENNKYGYKDQKGQVIVAPIYDDAKYQNEYGFVAVNRDGKWGALNYLGEVIVKPEKEFTDFLLIDFINTWFRDKDLNLNSYTR